MENLKSLIGTKADIAQWARIFTQETCLSWPESEQQLITNGEDGVFYGILWEEFRPIRKVVIQWEGKPPKPNEVQLENWVSKDPGMNLSTGSMRTTWWVGSWHPFFASQPEVQGNKWVFGQLAYGKNYYTACKLRLRSLVKRKKPLRIRSVEIFSDSIWSPLQVELEWGFDSENTFGNYDGRIEIYNGIVGSVRPLEPGGSTKMIGPGEWQSQTKKSGNSRHGVIVELLYTEPAHDPEAEVIPPWGTTSLVDVSPNRTILTIRTESGNCSFLADDLKSNSPILVADLGLFAVKHEAGLTARDILNKQKRCKPKTFRQRIAEMPEQTWKAVSSEFAGKMAAPKAYFGSFAFSPSGPNYSQGKTSSIEYLPGMKISVPEPRMNEAWKRGAAHLRAPCKKRADGTYDIPDAPYPTIAQECCTILRALDMMGFHKIVPQAIAGWLVRQGTNKPFGKFKTKKGCLILDGYDNHAPIGPGVLLAAIADHYQMTGDKKWLEQVKPHVRDCCSWIVRERKWAMKSAPDGTKAWAYGLQPPCHNGDAGECRPWYFVDIYYYFGLLRCGDVFADIDHKFSKRLLQQAEEYRKDISAAVESSATLTPVRKIQDGSYRRTIPPMPYSRRMKLDADPREVPWLDVEVGAINLANVGLLGLRNRLTESMMDVLEDNILVSVVDGKNFTGDKEGFIVDKDWFHYGGKAWINGYFVLPEIYLRRDDIKHFLRGFWNSYAALTDLKSYRMREVPAWKWVGKIFETARFLTRLRNLLIMEENQKLWIARAAPRSWLQDGNKIKVSAAPTSFGEVSYTITSHTNKGKIRAAIEMPKRSLPEEIFVRFRHPQRFPIKKVKVNGQEWKVFDIDREVIILRGRKGHLTLEADYDISPGKSL